MKWSEIKSRILDKLFMSESEATSQGYVRFFRGYANEMLNVVANGIKPKIATYTVITTIENEQVTMPDNFISHSDMPNYLDDEANPDIIYVNDRELILPIIGTYKIYYNAEWDVITEEISTTDVQLDIDTSILRMIPTYVASKVLQQDDIQRAMILLNEYELMLGRLDTNIMYGFKDYTSSKGWY